MMGDKEQALKTTVADSRSLSPALPAAWTAEALVSRNVPRMAPDVTAGAVRRALTTTAYDSVEDIAVCEGDRFVGLIRIEEVLTAVESALVRDIMDADPPFVTSTEHREAAAWKAVRRGEGSLPVVDDEGRFVGLIPPWRMLGVLLAEHDEDVARLSGFMGSARTALETSEESIPRRYWHRLPWLVLGLLGSVGAAVIISGSEEALAENLVLAFFMPGIVYMADAVGTQTEALVIRGLSVGVGIGDVVRRELITGLLIGASLAAIFLPTVAIGWGRVDVAVAVALSLFAACSTATGVALALPWLLNRFGRDPAFGSGPLATVIQDLVSIVLYFAITGAIVR
jgi:magnesium transporter